MAYFTADIFHVNKSVDEIFRFRIYVATPSSTRHNINQIRPTYYRRKRYE